jgi:hypothetical protein
MVLYDPQTVIEGFNEIFERDISIYIIVKIDLPDAFTVLFKEPGGGQDIQRRQLIYA